MRRWVVDTSPLLFLSKLDRLELLRKSADSLLVPPAVWSEVEARRDEATERVQQALRAAWLELRKPMGSPGRDLESLRGIGEIEVLLLAQEVGAWRKPAFEPARPSSPLCSGVQESNRERPGCPIEMRDP